MTAVAPPSELLLARGHELTAKVREVMAELSAWVDELDPGRPERVDADMHASAALIQLTQALAAIGVFTQIAAEMG